MANKTYVIVCRCEGNNLKAFENLDYYRMIGRKYKQHKNNHFKK